MIVEYSQRLESPEFNGVITSNKDLYDINSAVDITIGNLAIKGSVLRKKSTWIGMLNTNMGTLYEYRFSFTNQNFYNTIKIMRPMQDLQQCASYSPIEILNIPSSGQFYCHFSGTVLNFINWIADCAGKTWKLRMDGKVELLSVSNQDLTFPDRCLSTSIEEGYFTGKYNGVRWHTTTETSMPYLHRVFFEKDKLRVSIESTFDDSGKYVLVYAEYTEHLHYDDIDTGVPFSVDSYHYGGVQGLSDQLQATTTEWAHEDSVTSVLFKMRKAIPYPEDAVDVNRVIYETFWNSVFSGGLPAFHIYVNRVSQTTHTNTIGDEPYLDILIGIPKEFSDNYANKMLFFNTQRKKLTYKKEYLPDEYDQLPVLGGTPLVRKIDTYCDMIHDYIIADVEVYG